MILLKNGTYIDWKTLAFTRTDLLVGEGAGGAVKELLPGAHCPAGTTVIDCTGRFITKSFANGHHHVYSALARGMPAPKKTPENFTEILQYVWWNLDKALDLPMIRASAMSTAIACAKSGVTFVIDHHASPNAVDGSLETIAEAFDAVGVGHLLCYEISDRDGKEIAARGLAETENYIGKRPGLVGLHASFTVGDDTLKQAVKLAERYSSGIHIHVAEDRADQNHCLETYGSFVVDRLARHGVLQFPKTILGHCLHLDEQERGLVAGSPAWVVQNMESNLNNRVGLFSSQDLGSRIILGTDGMHSDMIRSAQAAFFAGQLADTIDYPGAYDRFRKVHGYLAENGIPGDGDNNLVVFAYDSPTPLNHNNFFGHFLFGFAARQVEHVIARGKLIVENRRVVTVNEAAVLDEAKCQAEQLWRKL